jgi:hypothetical protein
LSLNLLLKKYKQVELFLKDKTKLIIETILHPKIKNKVVLRFPLLLFLNTGASFSVKIIDRETILFRLKKKIQIHIK